MQCPKCACSECEYSYGYDKCMIKDETNNQYNFIVIRNFLVFIVCLIAICWQVF